MPVHRQVFELGTLRRFLMAVDTIRIVESDRDVLLRLKRSTGIRNWNILCRWAFCMSLADQSQTSVDPRGQDSGVEMTWKVFGGVHADVYWALLIQRLKNDGVPRDQETIERYFYRHLHRGIGLLVNISTKASLAQMMALTSK